MLFRILKDIFRTRPRTEASANPLVDWFSRHNGRYISKWRHYFDIYHRHFARYRGRSPVVVEIGVFHGGSLDMWRDYFGKGCKLYGVDIDPRCRMFEAEDTQIFIGDQGDRDFLRRLRRDIPRVDILIDDGGHTMQQQIATFEELFPHVADDGVYLCEDLHTSYWAQFGGGYRAEGSFIEFSKKLVDELNAWHSVEPLQFQMSEFTRTANALHFYDSVLVVEKTIVTPPHPITAGEPSY